MKLLARLLLMLILLMCGAPAFAGDDCGCSVFRTQECTDCCGCTDCCNHCSCSPFVSCASCAGFVPAEKAADCKPTHFQLLPHEFETIPTYECETGVQNGMRCSGREEAPPEHKRPLNGATPLRGSPIFS